MDYQKTLDIAADRAWLKLQKQHHGLRCAIRPIIKINNRFSKTAGRCLVEYNIVELGSKFFVDYFDEILKVTLPHELCHQADVNLHGIPQNNRWHGPTWQKIMLQYGLPPDTYHSMEIVK